MLTDAGPLVSVVVRRDPGHARCVTLVATLSSPMVTTWPAFAEAMYLVQREGGWVGQAALWRLVERGALQLVDLSGSEVARMRVLMQQYQDLPMDLADA